MKKLLYFLIPLGLLISGVAVAVNVTVPQATSVGGIPIGLSGGNYAAGFISAGSNITISTSTPGQIQISSTGGSSQSTSTIISMFSATAPITLNSSTGAIGIQSNFGSMNVWTSGAINASTSNITNLTVTTGTITNLTTTNATSTLLIINGNKASGLSQHSFQLGSSTPDTLTQAKFETGTYTAASLFNPSEATVITKIFCKTDAGTLWIALAGTSVKCSSSGASATPGTVIAAEGDTSFIAGSPATSPKNVTVTFTTKPQ